MSMNIFTAQEAAEAALTDFDWFLNILRKEGSKVESDDPRRALIIRLGKQFGDLEDAVLARFGQPSRKGPPRPELAPDPDAPDGPGQLQKLPWAGPVSPTNRVAKNSSARWKPGGEQWTA